MLRATYLKLFCDQIAGAVSPLVLLVDAKGVKQRVRCLQAEAGQLQLPEEQPNSALFCQLP